MSHINHPFMILFLVCTRFDCSHWSCPHFPLNTPLDLIFHLHLAWQIGGYSLKCAATPIFISVWCYLLSLAKPSQDWNSPAASSTAYVPAWVHTCFLWFYKLFINKWLHLDGGTFSVVFTICALAFTQDSNTDELQPTSSGLILYQLQSLYIPKPYFPY